MQAISYLRVSTDQQGRSGLGLEAQRAAVVQFAATAGFDIAAEYVEVETGKGANALARRPQLQAAIAHARKLKAKLVFAKLDRLARNVHFISGLIESKADIAFADMPHADRFYLHIMAALAEQEARMISQRTKAALAAAKARGQELGRNGKVLAARNKAQAMERAAPLAGLLQGMKAEGMTMRAMVARLNDEGVASPAGGKWHLANLDRAWKRVQAMA